MAKINEKEVSKLMETLEISREEALELVSFDKEEIDNEEVAKVEEKVKAAEKPKKKKGSSLDKVKLQKAKKKADKVKDGILAVIANMTNASDQFQNVQNLTPTKFTFVATDGSFYTVSLTKHKVKPDGYHVEE